MLEEVESHPRLLRSLSFGDDDYSGLALSFLRKMIGSNDENLGTVLAFIRDKSASDGEDVSSAKSGERKIVFSPSIFEVPTESADPTLVSVMMPFNDSLREVYSAIQHAASNTGLTCRRADDIWNHSTVIQDVFSLIFRSYIVVCDFTGKNPNVFYEAGIAHTLGKHVVPITQADTDIPFDLQHHRYLKYLNNGEGRAKLSGELTNRFATLVQQRSAWP
jgi:hypothetical protein